MCQRQRDSIQHIVTECDALLPIREWTRRMTQWLTGEHLSDIGIARLLCHGLDDNGARCPVLQRIRAAAMAAIQHARQSRLKNSLARVTATHAQRALESYIRTDWLHAAHRGLRRHTDQPTTGGAWHDCTDSLTDFKRRWGRAVRITASQHLLVVLDEADLYTDEDDEALDIRPELVRYNSKSETAACILDLAEGTIVIFTDGGCDGNGNKIVELASGRLQRSRGASGWGVSIYVKRGDNLEPCDELYGPVVTDARSAWYLHCLRGTNNTGELCAMANALLWLLHISPQDLHGSPVCIVYDSGYAAGATQRTAPMRSNVEAVALNRRLLAEVQRGRRHGSVTFVHVKGHSDDPGNERADELVQWGKGKGPTGQQYKRLDIDGGYEEPAPTKMDAARLPQAIQLQYYKQATT